MRITSITDWSNHDNTEKHILLFTKHYNKSDFTFFDTLEELIAHVKRYKLRGLKPALDQYKNGKLYEEIAKFNGGTLCSN